MTPIKELHQVAGPDAYDPVLAGPDGIDNLQGKQLANRTVHLKERIDKLESGEKSSGNAIKLNTARKIEVTGDGSWNVMFDGSSNASAALTLASTGVAPGSYGMVTVDAKGRVTAGRAMTGNDVPSHDWSKITSGRPTTLAGYGITDAAPLGQMLDSLALKLSIDAQGRASTTTFRAKKGYPASDNATNGFAFESDGDTGMFAAGGDGTNSGVTEIALVIDSKPVFLAKPIGLWNQSYGWLHLYFAQKSTTLAGYGITDAAPASAGVPTGMICWYANPSAPAGWLICDGKAISRMTYAALFAVIGTTYGVGDGTTTFNLPDLRDQFIRGHNAGNGRAFGSRQPGSIVPYQGYIDQKNGSTGSWQSSANDRLSWVSSLYDDGLESNHADGVVIDPAKYNVIPPVGWQVQLQSSSSQMVGTAASTSNLLKGARPQNVTLLPCIKI
ncbi:phage tail protein [Chromobacterium violaceum]|uniref:phage tail protein n=1 Tax=Chromobacterium violaceum TaxID=536 RepID=UPI001CC54C8E|nr:phage tail protein [Chromobacterium violaceum]